MSLNSFYFILSLLPLMAIMAALQLVRKKASCDGNIRIAGRIQIAVLLVYSYIFICSADIRFGLCIFFMTVVSYGIGRAVDWADSVGDFKLQAGTVGGARGEVSEDVEKRQCITSGNECAYQIKNVHHHGRKKMKVTKKSNILIRFAGKLKIEHAFAGGGIFLSIKPVLL